MSRKDADSEPSLLRHLGQKSSRPTLSSPRIKQPAVLQRQVQPAGKTREHYQVRGYQRKGIDLINAAWIEEGHKSVMFQMPTGTGKTILFCELTRRGDVNNRRVLIVAHRRELIDQTIDKLAAFGVECGVLIPGAAEDPAKRIQVASIQTLARRKRVIEPDLVIIDEAHHAVAATYSRLWERFPGSKFLGVTATPRRLSRKQGFDHLFDKLIEAPPIQWFIDQGFLADVECFVQDFMDASQLRVRAGDYTSDSVNTLMNTETRTARVVESYLEHAKGMSNLVFAVNVEHSMGLVEKFREAGVVAAHVDAKTPAAERADLLERFRRRDIQVISNVEIVTEGFDFPGCEVVQLVRPTKSLALYLQMVGRVMRTAKGKEKGIILDHAGLMFEHGAPTAGRKWSLKPAPPRQKKLFFTVPVERDGYAQPGIPEEVADARLVPLSTAPARKGAFNNILAATVRSGHKSVRAWYRFCEVIEGFGLQVSKADMQYGRRKIEEVDRDRAQDKRLNPGFWYHEGKRFD